MSDKDFLRLFSYMVGGLAALTVVIFIVAQVVGSMGKVASADAAAMGEKAVSERIKPVGKVVVRSERSIIDTIIPKANAAASGKADYSASCGTCHDSGAAGAPKLGDKAAWKARIAQGKATLYKHAINGFKGMPPRGASSLSDAKIKAVVDYMVMKSK